MATKLIKGVSREMLSRPQLGKDRNRSIVVSLVPGDILSFRSKGSKRTIGVPLASCYALAVILDIKNTHTEKMKAYELKKKAGYKVKKPKAPILPFNKILFKVL